MSFATDRFYHRLGSHRFVDLHEVERYGLGRLSETPYVVRVLLEAALRRYDGRSVTEEQIAWLARRKDAPADGELAFYPARILLQDLTGTALLTDLAAMRDRVAALGGDPLLVNPHLPVDLVVDHSVQVDHWGSAGALALNERLELRRNRERYRFLKWSQQALEHVRVVPSAKGIVHQVNLEFLSPLMQLAPESDLLFPDSCIGTDSHTPMINGLGVVGWGAGGIEVESVLLGEPIALTAPRVIGVRLSGRARSGVTATDIVLTLTALCRQHGVVGAFLEAFGTGAGSLPVETRATIANMTPELGATVTYFPIDQQSISYLRRTGRPDEIVQRAETFARAQGLYAEHQLDPSCYDAVIELDLAAVEPCIAGPWEPHQRQGLSQVPASFTAFTGGVDRELTRSGKLEDGGVVIAAITSCTNTSNPEVMIAAGLLARRAVARGLTLPPFVKASLAPGSTVVTEYLRKLDLLEPLARLGFHLVGYGCTTCIGNSGPLAAEVEAVIRAEDIAAAAVLSGNRNFTGRVHPLVRGAYLASPPMVVAYALLGNVRRDITSEPLGFDRSGVPVHLAELWPAADEIAELLTAVTPDLFRDRGAELWRGTDEWDLLPVPAGDRYEWDPASTYLQPPPLFGLNTTTEGSRSIAGARALARFGDGVSTDHISPAGAISRGSPAADYLLARGVEESDWNTYGARRGHSEVMVRGTFANLQLRNRLVAPIEGNVTIHFPSSERVSIYEAAERYRRDGVPLVILAGKQYGQGSSRDWAAKGPRLLGVRAVLAESYERIHRSNLAGMGVLPLQFLPGESAESLGLTGAEIFNIAVPDHPAPGEKVPVIAVRDDARSVTFTAVLRLDTRTELAQWQAGGILDAMVERVMTKVH